MKVCPACNRDYGDEDAVCIDDGVALVRVDSRDQEAQDLIGTVVDGRYRLEHVVGRGGMGTVYACRHVVVGKAFAMKVLRSGVERSEEILQRFIREAQATNEIKSRHICEMTDFGQLPGGAFYVVMELLDGMSLTRALREKRLDRAAIIHVFRQIAETLERAHKVGIVHRDLKPDNVVIIEDESDPVFVKLVDFGIAKIIRAKATNLTETGIILGTPYYMSPEQARGDDVDHRSDIYAIGIMMYRAFTGKLPFLADTQMGVLTRHLTEAPQLPSEIANIDPITERLILRCLEKLPIDRFQSMLDVVEALDSLATRPATRPPIDSSPTLDEHSLPRPPEKSFDDGAPRQRAPRPPRPSVPPNAEPTPTKIETPQAQNRSGLGRPLPFPPSLPSAPAQEAAPRSLPPPLPTAPPETFRNDIVEPRTSMAPGAVAAPDHTRRRSAPAPASAIQHQLDLTPHPHPVSPPAAPAGAPYAAPLPIHSAYPSDQPPHPFAAATYPESLTNRGVVSSRRRAIGRRRQAQRAAAWVTVGVAGIVIGTLVALVAVDRRDGREPSPASATDSGDKPSDVQLTPEPSAVSTAPTSNSATHDVDTTATNPSPTAATSGSASAAAVAPKPPPSPRQRYRPSPPRNRDSPTDNIRSPFE